METIAKVRRDRYVAGKSIKRIAKDRKMSKNTVRKILRADATALEYRRTEAVQPRPKLGEYVETLEQWLKADAKLPRKQRRNARRMWDMLREEGYEGAYDSIQRFVKQWKQEQGFDAAKGAFVPLAFDPGDAMQFDWSLETVVIGGVTQAVKVGHFRLCYSRKMFIVAFPREKLEMVMEAHNRAIAYFGGVTNRIIYDNPKTIVNKILAGKERDTNKRFLRLASHYLFEPVMCNPASGWEKGQVEKQVQNMREWVFTPTLRVDSMEALNVHLRAECDRIANERKHPEFKDKTIAEAFAEEAHLLRKVPRPFEAYTEHECLAKRTLLVGYDRVCYSVDSTAAGRHVTLRAYADRIVVLHQDKWVAEHPRSFVRGKVVYDPWHYLAVLERKPGALRDGAPFKHWPELPASMHRVRKLLSKQVGGDREFVNLLCAAREHGVEAVAGACQSALDDGVVREAWILNCLSRDIAPPEPPAVEAADLVLHIEPEANCVRYDAMLTGIKGAANVTIH